MTSALPTDIQSVVDQAVNEGRYGSAEEYLRAAVSLLQERDRRQLGAADEFRAKVAEGLAELDAGLGQSVTAEQSIARARKAWVELRG